MYVHFNVVQRIFWYLFTTLDFKLVYNGTSSSTLFIAYVDIDNATNVDDRKSYSRYILFLNGGQISWRSKKQAYLVDNMTYFEYISYYMPTKEII